MRNKFTSWYSEQVRQQLDNELNLEDINIKI